MREECKIMILAKKRCSNCKEVNEVTWIPNDMLNESFNCPVCNKGIVNYSSDSEKFKNSKLIVIQAINESISRGEIPFDIGNRAIQTITELPNV